MLDVIRRYRFRRRVVACVEALLCPVSIASVRGELAAEISLYAQCGTKRGWSPEMAAAIVAAIYLANLIRSLDVGARARLAEDMRKAPKDPAAEIAWLSDMEGEKSGADPLHVRLRFINGLLASWLVRDRIDLFTKLTFVTATIQAAAELDAATINEALAFHIARMGTRARRPPQATPHADRLGRAFPRSAPPVLYPGSAAVAHPWTSA